MSVNPDYDDLARYLGQPFINDVESAEWRVGREFLSLDAADRPQLIQDIIDVYNTGDQEHQVAVKLRDLLNADTDDEG